MRRILLLCRVLFPRPRAGRRAVCVICVLQYRRTASLAIKAHRQPRHKSAPPAWPQRRTASLAKRRTASLVSPQAGFLVARVG